MPYPPLGYHIPRLVTKILIRVYVFVVPFFTSQIFRFISFHIEIFQTNF